MIAVWLQLCRRKRGGLQKSILFLRAPTHVTSCANTRMCLVTRVTKNCLATSLYGRHQNVGCYVGNKLAAIHARMQLPRIASMVALIWFVAEEQRDNTAFRATAGHDPGGPGPLTTQRHGDDVLFTKLFDDEGKCAPRHARRNRGWCVAGRRTKETATTGSQCARDDRTAAACPPRRRVQQPY